MTDVHPLVQGRCPACRGASLFLGSGGHVTCSRLDCPNPTAADDLLHGEQRAAAPAATQAGEPREHCGDPMPAWSVGPRSECTLRPGHQGSHADDRGARWWYDPISDSSGPCTCGGRFPLQHLHADQHQQTGNHTGPSRVVHTASATPPTENP